MRTILFLCTGNTCRSPLAEAIARHLIAEGLLGTDPGFFVASAGVAALNGSPPTPEAVAALQAVGIEHHGRSTHLSADMVRNAHVVLAMTSGHVQTARALADNEEDDKIMRLDPDTDIADPIGLDQPAYDALVKQFMELIPRRLKELFES